MECRFYRLHIDFQQGETPSVGHGGNYFQMFSIRGWLKLQVCLTVGSELERESSEGQVLRDFGRASRERLPGADVGVDEGNAGMFPSPSLYLDFRHSITPYLIRTCLLPVLKQSSLVLRKRF